MNVRLLPIVVMAASALLVLKVGGLVTGGGYVLTGVSALSAQEQQAELAAAELAARAMFESVSSATEGGVPVPTRDFNAQLQGLEGTIVDGSTEQVILERLAERRAELDALAQELEMRLSLVEVAEARIEEKLAELAAMESRINANMDAQDNRDTEQFAGLVSMYENMRPADAATIFNDLEMAVLLRVGRAMNPRKLGPIMAKMLPVRAQELTIRMAAADDTLTAAAPTTGFDHLPQIVGQ